MFKMSASYFLSIILQTKTWTNFLDCKELTEASTQFTQTRVIAFTEWNHIVFCSCTDDENFKIEN